jgi:hypothetical protein
MNFFYGVVIMIFMNGATAALSQIILMREISYQVNMDIRVYSYIAAAWLLAVLIYRLFVSEKYMRKAKDSSVALIFGMSPVANAFLIPVFLYLSRYLRPILRLAPGTDTPLWGAAILCLVVFTPVAFMFISGFMAGIETMKRKKAGSKATSLYFFELTGIILAACAYYVFFRQHYAGIDIIYTLGLVNLTVVYIFFRGKSLEARYTMLAVIAAAIVYIAFNIAGVKDNVEKLSNGAAYSGYEIIADREYATVRFTMAKKDGVYYVFEDGKLSYRVDDPEYAKAASAAKGPKVLVINGGLSGMITALAMNKSVRDIVSVETDPYTGFLLQNILKPEIPSGVKVENITGDITGNPAYTATGVSFDSIILTCRPAGIRGYTAEYFTKIKKMLAPGGVLIVRPYGSMDVKISGAVKGAFGSADEAEGIIAAR